MHCHVCAKRYPESVIQRYADLVLAAIHRRGGQGAYVRLRDLEEDLGLEQSAIFCLCRQRLYTEVQVVWRAPDDLREQTGWQEPYERWLVETLCREVHVRIRPPQLRLTERELLKVRRKEEDKARRKKGRRKR